MNRKGFLKRIAGALGLLAVGNKVVAKVEPFPGRHYWGIRSSGQDVQRMMNHRVSEIAQQCAEDIKFSQVSNFDHQEWLSGTKENPSGTFTIRRPVKYEEAES